MFYGIIY